MGTVHFFFGKPINSDTATAAVHGSRAVMGEKDGTGAFLWDHFHYSISCGGGDIIAAFGLFNEMKGMPVKVTTHNSGAIDSAAIMPFMVGERRTASPHSAFFFHQVRWTFSTNAHVPIYTINEAAKWLGVYENMMADYVGAQSGQKSKKILNMMREGTSISSADAKALGLIHDVCECSVPQDARTWQV